MWNSHLLTLELHGPRARFPWECPQEYFTWFYQISNHIMTKPENFSKLHMSPLCNWDSVMNELERLLDKGCILTKIEWMKLNVYLNVDIQDEMLLRNLHNDV
ncbi:hypothetical protein FRX31_012392 [Thalictrum thalictroides]|uniref:Uncharacterized protein n=1 Tax=Thalictrum thalictroides TaxID=46969 RepID=A0A7J6WKW5_THATH|nr:hypothetical protein FRX31_012392 [Thalictrum thalictroides]